MKAIELSIFHHSELTDKAEAMDILLPLKEYTTRPMTFYNIDAIAPFIDYEDPDQPEYTKVFSGGEEFTCIDSYNTLKNKINEKRELQS